MPEWPQGLVVEAHTYNSIISTCIKLGETDGALDVYKRSLCTSLAGVQRVAGYVRCVSDVQSSIPEILIFLASRERLLPVLPF